MKLFSNGFKMRRQNTVITHQLYLLI